MNPWYIIAPAIVVATFFGCYYVVYGRNGGGDNKK